MTPTVVSGKDSVLVESSPQPADGKSSQFGAKVTQAQGLSSDHNLQLP